jgi:hypothetical protein
MHPSWHAHLNNLVLLVSTHWNEAHGVIHFIAALTGNHCH